MLVSIFEHTITASVFFTLGAVFMAILQIAKESDHVTTSHRR